MEQITVSRIPIGKPRVEDEIVRVWRERGKLPSVEETDRGDCLCLLSWSGRFFRDDPDTVREIVDKYVEDYRADCEKSAEDPAKDYNKEYDLNELYYRMGIVPTHFGNEFLYETSQEWAQDIKVVYEMVYPSTSDIAEAFGEQIYIIDLADRFSFPHEREEYF